MANPIKGQVPLKLSDGREFLIVLDHEALIQAGSAYGKGIKGLFRDMSPPLGADGKPQYDEEGDLIANPNAEAATRALLYGALLAYQPRMTLRDASTLLFTEPDAVAEALDAASEASELAPKAGSEGKKNPNPPPAKTGRGKTSGASGASAA